jgi:flagellar motor switch protein FliM
LLRKISADFSYQRPRSPIEARRQIEKKLLGCFFSLELSMPSLQVPLQNLSELRPNDMLPFSRKASDPAVLMVDDVRLCTATPVRLNNRRAARVLITEALLLSADQL